MMTNESEQDKPRIVAAKYQPTYQPPLVQEIWGDLTIHLITYPIASALQHQQRCKPVVIYRQPAVTRDGAKRVAREFLEANYNLPTSYLTVQWTPHPEAWDAENLKKGH